MKLGVTGSRLANDKEQIYAELDKLAAQYNIELLVSGGAYGADSICEKWAEERNVPVKQYLPDYESYGKRAPLYRNAEIVDAADMLIAFPAKNAKSNGTKYTIKLAKDADKTVITVETVVIIEEY